MRFIIDAHLPKSLCQIFINLGHEALHTSDLPDGNEADDKDIILIASEDGIIVTKDGDFYLSFLIQGQPSKLIHVKVGNMKLKELKTLFSKVAPKLIDLLGQYDLLELHKDKVIVIA